MRLMPPLKDPYKLPTSTRDFRPWHVKVLRRLNKHSVNEPFSGIITLEVDIPRFTKILMKLHLIEYASYEDALSFMTMDNLRAILQENRLPKTGVKKELISRILSEIDENKVRSSIYYSDYYVHTPAGKEIVDSSYERFEREELEFFNQVIDLLLSHKYDLAWRLANKKRAEYPVGNLLGLDPKKLYHNGLSLSMKKQSRELMESAEDPEVTAGALFGLYYGCTTKRIEYLLSLRRNTFNRNDE